MAWDNNNKVTRKCLVKEYVYVTKLLQIITLMDINVVNFFGVLCPCCGHKLRARPRDPKLNAKLKEKRAVEEANKIRILHHLHTVWEENIHRNNYFPFYRYYWHKAISKKSIM